MLEEFVTFCRPCEEKPRYYLLPQDMDYYLAAMPHQQPENRAGGNDYKTMMKTTLPYREDKERTSNLQLTFMYGITFEYLLKNYS